MKLDWKRAGCASIAEWNGVTFAAFRSTDDSVTKKRRFHWNAIDKSGKFLVGSAYKESIKGSLKAAEKACEVWAENWDHPNWRRPADMEWIWAATWRGHKLRVWSSEVNGAVAWMWGAESWHVQDENLKCADEAKSAAEQWVREQGEK